MGKETVDSGIRMAILRKPDLKVIALQHDYGNDTDLFANVPWDEMNSVQGMVSGTRGYMFHDPDLAKDGEYYHTVGIEVPVDMESPLEGMFTRVVPSSAYGVFYREPGTDHDAFKVAMEWKEDGWEDNPEVTVWSYDDYDQEGFFVFAPVVSTQKEAAVPEIPSDPFECYRVIKESSRAVLL